MKITLLVLKLSLDVILITLKVLVEDLMYEFVQQQEIGQENLLDVTWVA